MSVLAWFRKKRVTARAANTRGLIHCYTGNSPGNSCMIPGFWHLISGRFVFNACPINWLSPVASGIMFAFFTGLPLQAQEAIFEITGNEGVEISHRPCSGMVELVATKVMLSEALQALASELSFDLRFQTDNDRRISVNMQKSAADLIAALGRDDSVIIVSKPDDRCSEAVERITQVWFFGVGPEIVYQPATVIPADRLPETGGSDAYSVRISEADKRYDEYRERQKEGKRRKDMTPEERYNDKIERRAAKGRD